ncbi:glycoside hydrolase superfamily [Apiospora marii]|uniref:Glycoside hydrolase superfamily n=1 Tax=Apiospora marii TaxID=335849 RepID=A0ABR1SD35_9PEZI
MSPSHQVQSALLKFPLRLDLVAESFFWEGDKWKPKSSLQYKRDVSYADIAASGPKQSPEEAAAPQPPEVVSTESASTSSLVDVDTPSVRTVPSDFGEQDIQTETQAARRDREEEQRRAESDLAKKKAAGKAKARKADSFLTKWFGDINDEASTALVISNLVGVVGLSGFLGYKAWDLHARNRLTWQSVGLGLGIMGVVGAVEGVFGRYLYKGKKNQSS